MCGIAGLINFRGGRDAAKVNMERMKYHMRDRGPDANGTWITEDGAVCFGHQRLAIHDLSEAGAQPFHSASGRYVIVFNGEIYNFEEMADDLKKDGFVREFRSTSDTEVLIESIEAYGFEETMKKSKGMFAIAVYDRKTGEITLSRDRIGEKPLYYGFVDNSFAFASDCGCFTEIDGFNREINREVLPIYLTHGYIPAPYSIYQNIWKLMPGQILRISEPYQFFVPEVQDILLQYAGISKVDHHSIMSGSMDTVIGGNGHEFLMYWSMADAARYGQKHQFAGSFEEASDELERLLTQSIRHQMVADVPVGAFLSAGIDSGTVVSLMQQVAPGKVKSFTIGMDEKKYDEAEVAAQIASHIGTEHTELYVSAQDMKDTIPMLPHMFGEPFADSSQIPTYLVSKMTRQHVTVSLSGDAGDELFCGYNNYTSVGRIWDKMSGYPLGIRQAIGAASLSLLGGEHTGDLVNNGPGGVYSGSFSADRKQVMRDKAHLLRARGPVDLNRIQLTGLDYDPRLLAAGYRTSNSSDAGQVPYQLNLLGGADRSFVDAEHEMMLFDMLMYHPDDILAKVDRTAMAVSLETRVPMLDKDVVEFAWTLPQSYLRGEDAGKQVGKKILRNILYRHVPRELVDRPKKGFSIPIARWLKDSDLREWAEELLSENNICKQGLLDYEYVKKTWDDFVIRGIWRPQIWYMLMLCSWKAELDQNQK